MGAKARRGAPSTGAERVAADAMAFRHLADASHRVFPIHRVKQPSFFIPGAFLPPGFLRSSFTFVAADPKRGDWRSAERRHSLVRVAQVMRDATLARRGPSRATGRPASRRSAVALSALHRLPARGLACGRADAKAPRPPGIAA